MKFRFMSALLMSIFLSASLNIRAETFLVDISKAANTSIEDDGISGNNAGGWSDEGINDMFIFPAVEFGDLDRNGYKFRVIDPKSNDNKSVIMLKGLKCAKDKPESVELKVPDKKGAYVYFLQNSVGGVSGEPKNYPVATYAVNYKDGSKVEIPMQDEIEIRRWWSKNWWDNSEEKAWPFFMGKNIYSMKWNTHIGVWAMQWKNPSPGKEITSIVLKSAGKAVPVIWAVTISDENFFEPKERRQKNIVKVENPPAAYFAAKLAVEREGVFSAAVKAGHFKGLRKIDLIRNDILALSIDSAIGKIGAGNGEGMIEQYQKPENFMVTSPDDPAYKTGVAPAKVGRQSLEFWNGNIGPFPQNILYMHNFYVYLPSPMKNGCSYTVKVQKGLSADFKSEDSIKYDDKATATPVIKVNQMSYSPLSQRRYAYLGWWAGDAGKVDYSQFASFQILDDKNAKVLDGKIELRRKDDPLSGEDVYQLDISQLKNEGIYHIQIPGLGCSDAFGLGGDRIRQLYYNTVRAFFHQRCGCELKKPFTDWERKACHAEVYKSGHVKGEGYAPAAGEESRKFSGGYHDAADFDTFTYHLRATSQSLAVFEWFPEKFKDSDLNLPESGNKIPDILDEAEWALSFYIDNQQEDGGIPLGRGNECDFLRDYQAKHKTTPPFAVFPPTIASTSEYAAVAAQFARDIRNFDQKKADRFLKSAEKAYAWIARNPGDLKDDKEKSDANLNYIWAAAELFSTTGDTKYNDDFIKLYNDGAVKKAHWSQGQYSGIRTWAYTVCTRPGADKKIQDELKKRIIDGAGSVVKNTELPAYRMGRGENGSGGWGNTNGGGYYADPCLRAYFLTKDQKYLDAASLNADFQLGCNPLSKTFITSIGPRHPNAPQINPLLYSGPEKTGTMVEGITVYGLSGGVSEDKKSGMMKNWYPLNVPFWRCWRDLGNGSAEVSSEFTITETIGASAMLYEFLYANEKK
ncbi:MAG TPA: hypothetical protein DET40_01780 [Lentisphaeria bacterium]|nr:MAG: hypothetical protein A2X45_11640 [Lentisphaerae bacterium GWF2_50_93]HCE42262.1 hypothetical protein [Lentisphaeria bacterium]